MFEQTIKPFTFEGALHGKTPMFRSHKIGIGGASNGANEAEAGSIEGLNSSDNSERNVIGWR